MSTLRYSGNEYLGGAVIREFFEAVSDELVRRGWPAITIVSGTRLYETQEAIFRARYVPASQVNGRKVYDFQTWNGVLWARISSAGRVAPPSRQAPHVANIAADLGAPYNVYGRARDALLQVVRDLGLEGVCVNNGTGFGEVWHWESRRGTGSIGRPAGQEEEEDMQPDERNVLMALQSLPAEVEKIRAALLNGHALTGWRKPMIESIFEGVVDVQDRIVSLKDATGVRWDVFQELVPNVRILVAAIGRLSAPEAGMPIDVDALAAAIRDGLDDDIVDQLAKRLALRPS